MTNIRAIAVVDGSTFANRAADMVEQELVAANGDAHRALQAIIDRCPARSTHADLPVSIVLMLAMHILIEHSEELQATIREEASRG